MSIKGSVLIAGATGFIGSAVVNHLNDNGYNVKILVRNVAKARNLFTSDIQILKWPEPGERLLLPGNERCLAVINLVGENIGAYRWTPTYKKKLVESRVDSVMQLTRLINTMKNPPNLFIQASAVGYYGTNTLNPVDESGPRGEGFLAGLVNDWETAFLRNPLKSGRKVILRFGLVFDWSGGFLKQMKFLYRFGIAAYPGNGYQKMSWIHLSDLSEIIRQVIEDDAYFGAINVVSPEPVRFRDFASLMRKYSTGWIAMPVPSFIFRLVLGKEKTNEMLLANQDIVPGKLQAHQFSFHYPDFEKIVEKL